MDNRLLLNLIVGGLVFPFVGMLAFVALIILL
jgi:hypothetical protein